MGLYKIYTDFSRVKREYQLEKVVGDQGVAEKVTAFANPLMPDENDRDDDSLAPADLTLTKDELKHVPPRVIKDYMAKYDPHHKYMSKKDLKKNLHDVYKGELPVNMFFTQLDALKFDETIEEFWDAYILASIQELKKMHAEEKIKVEEDEDYELPFIQRAILINERAALKSDTDESSGKHHKPHSVQWLEARLKADDKLNAQWAIRNPHHCREEKRSFNIRWWRGDPKTFRVEMQPEEILYSKITEHHTMGSRVVGFLRIGDTVQVTGMRFDEQAGRWGGVRLCAHVHRIDQQTHETKLLTSGWFSAAAPPDHHHHTAWCGVQLYTDQTDRPGDASTLDDAVRLQYFAMRHALATRLAAAKRKPKPDGKNASKKQQAMHEAVRVDQLWYDDCCDCIAIDDFARAHAVDKGGKRRKHEQSDEALGIIDWRGQQLCCRFFSKMQDRSFDNNIVAVGLSSAEDSVENISKHNENDHWIARPSQVVQLHDLVVLSKWNKRKGWVPTVIRASVSGGSTSQTEENFHDGAGVAMFRTGWLTVSCPELPCKSRNAVYLHGISTAEFDGARDLDYPTKLGTRMRVLRDAIVTTGDDINSDPAYKGKLKNGLITTGQVRSNPQARDP